MHLIPTLQGGGAERQLALMATEHVKKGIEVAVVYHTDGPNLDYMKKEPVILHRLSVRNNYDPRALIAIVRFIRYWRPDIVQTWLPQMDILGGAAAYLTGVKHILSERASSLMYKDSWKTRLRMAAGRRSNAVVANSQSGALYWQNLNRRGPVHVIPNAVTPFDTSNTAVPFGMQKPCILYAGRLSHEKNLECMIAAMILALRRCSELNAYVLGIGPQEAELRNWISQANMESRIHLMGYVDNLYPWYNHASVFVSLSDFEGNPNVVLESASVGCPLVLSDIPEHRQALPAQAALFVNGHEPNAIADALLLALIGGADSEARVQLAQTAIRKLSVERQADEYIRVYQTLITQ